MSAPTSSAPATSAAPWWLRLSVLACAALTFVAAGLHAPFGQVLREDALAFIEQALALRAGDWTAEAHPVGWPALLATLSALLELDTPLAIMPLARGLSLLLLAAATLPLASLARRTAGDAAAALTALAWACSPALLHLGTIAYADPCFLFLALCAAATAAGAAGRPRSLLLAAALASLAYAVKPNALFLLVALVPVAWLQRRRAGAGAGAALGTVGLMLLVFVAVSLPHLWLRAETFGSPLSYGENSKYFVDSYAQVWDRSVPVPSLSEYLSSHTPAQWWHKFGRGGLLKVGWTWLAAMGPLWTLLLALAALGPRDRRDPSDAERGARRSGPLSVTAAPVGTAAAEAEGDDDGDADRAASDGDQPAPPPGPGRLARPPAAPGPSLLLPILWLTVSLGGLVPVFHIFGDRRYLTLVLPLVFLLACAGLVRWTAAWPRRRLVRLAFAAVLLLQLPLAFAEGTLALNTDPRAEAWTDRLTPTLQDGWVQWTVRHLPHPVAIVEGGDLLRLAWSEAEDAGELPAGLDGEGPFRTRRPGAYPDLDAALDDLWRLGVRHLLVEPSGRARRPYLADLDDPAFAGRVERLRHFEQPDGEDWLLPEMTVWRLLPADGDAPAGGPDAPPSGG